MSDGIPDLLVVYTLRLFCVAPELLQIDTPSGRTASTKSLTFVRYNLLLFRTRELVKKLFKLFKRLLCKRNALFRWKRFGAHVNSHRDSRISSSSFLKTKEALLLQSAASGVQA